MKAEIENLQQKVSSNKSKMAASDPESSKYFTQVIAIQQLKEESEALQREYETRKHQVFFTIAALPIDPDHNSIISLVLEK